MVKVSINVCFHNLRFLLWCQYQLQKLITYTNSKGISTELLICSECPEKYFEHYPKHTFVPCKEGETIGNKRNMLLERSKGQYICIVDSDDLQFKYRIKLQLELFERLPKDVTLTTTNRLMCYNISERRSYYVTCEAEGALFFKRTDARFGTEQIGEGLALAKGKRIYFENDHYLIIALQHSANTSYKNFDMNLGDIDEYLDENEKELIKELIY